MRENPRDDWRIEQIVAEAERAGVLVRIPSGGSHYTFASPYLSKIETVPHKRPIKPVYVRRLCRFIADHLEAGEGND